MKKYDHKKVEAKWQKIWESKKLSLAREGNHKKKYYVLGEFPYPSGDGLHTGHLRSFTALDVIARKRRAEGYNVLYPMGWDAFGLPTENYAIKTGIHPRIVTKKNTDNFRRQLKSLGFSFDWSREINTSDPAYYKWTQWIFLQFFKKGLAYKAKRPINWCLNCKIGLADEEVVNEKCERCGGQIEKREKEQWMLAITKYAERLNNDLELVDYPERVKTQQRNWIGKSEGAEISFPVEFGGNTKLEHIEVFTTRPDTLFGVTCMVLSPEHPWVEGVVSEKNKGVLKNVAEVRAYIKEAKAKSEIERTAENKEKTGIRLEGVSAVNPGSKKKIPIYVADYVLSSYGTGAVMAVPAHDERDFAFAEKYKIPVIQVIEPVYEQTTEPGKIREGEPYEERNAIIAIVKHWSEEKYLALKWKKVAWGTFITGGIEKGQTAEEAAQMEIREETGYLNPKLVSDFGKIHGKFYHVPKKVNRFAHSQVLHFKLQNGERGEVEKDELENHEVLWLSKEELKKFLTPDTHQHALRLLNGTQGPYEGEGILMHSGKFDGMESGAAGKEITKFVGGRTKTTFKLRDWVFSRQRYWGEPIPLIFCEKDGWVSVPEKDLPLELPKSKSFKPTDSGESPLAALPKWVNTKCPVCRGKARRETDVMPNWAGSSWYYLRYTDPKNKKAFAGKLPLKNWTPVDWYNGGMEHTTLHLLYSRFWHKFLYDLKLVPTKEPYQKRTSHGLILAEGGVKMSKSKGNVVNPDSIVKLLGADTLRHYEMFMGPFEQSIAWNTDAVAGSRRFLERVWKMFDKVERISPRKGGGTLASLETLLNQTVKKVTEDIETLKMNTALSQLMILLNAFEKEEKIPCAYYEILLRLLAPFAPHIADELWSMLGEKSSIHLEPWPKYDKKKLQAERFSIPVQVNGRIKATLSVSRNWDEDQIKGSALAHPDVLRLVMGKSVKKIIYVKERIVSIVL